MKDDDDKTTATESTGATTTTSENLSIEKTSDMPREKLQGSIQHRRASLTPVEAAFLHALLIDDTTADEQLEAANKKLDDDALFEVLPEEAKFNSNSKGEIHRLPPALTRTNRKQHGLWQAFEEGYGLRRLLKVHSSIEEKKAELSEQKREEKPEDDDDDEAGVEQDQGSVRSDEEVRVDKSQYDEDVGDDESWDEKDGGFEHYNAWEVLKDEYASDFGFDFSQRSSEEEMEADVDDGNHFGILGTSAADKAAVPHVLSPPLMDSLMTFFPFVLKNQNYWLKYSLIRDGASLNTFRRYVRGAPYTILAIETTDGHVFGSFTGNAWRNHFGRRFYGQGGHSFLWKMRHSRNEKCFSMLEQAKLESEIDVYVYTGENDFIQVCTDDRIAIGGGEVKSRDETSSNSHHFNDSYDDDKVVGSAGFGLTIDGDMLNGSSSPCATYRNPCLSHPSNPRGASFKIVNLEVWTMTPCVTVDSAERLEMTKFFVEESTRSAISGMGKSDRFSSSDLKQDEFYRRVGQRDESEAERNRWQYNNMMGGGI